MSIKDLVVNTNEIEEAAVESVVKKYFKYTPTGEILFVDKTFWKLGGDKKVLLLLVAVVGRKFLGLENAQLSVTNEYVEKKLNINANSIRVYISQARRQGLITTDKGMHMITTQGIHDLMEGQND